MGLLSRALDILLYTNVWIAGAAMALYIYTKHLLGGNFEVDNAALFLLANCTWLYSLHRFIGLRKIKTVEKENRFYKIKKLQQPILGVSIFAFISSIILLFTLPTSQIVVLLIPGALSLLYVLPVFPNGKRLRDINYIKIFVIAFVWAGLTALLPAAIDANPVGDRITVILFLERFIYIFAITLPFDIRDEAVDKLTGVKTIAARLGKNYTLLLCFILLAIDTLLNVHLTYLGLGYFGTPIIYYSTNVLTIGLIFLALRKKHDWYYTGGIDGAMYLPLFIWFLLAVLPL